MVNYLWAGFICLGILVAVFSGKIDVVTPSIFSAAEQAVKMAFGMISIMTFWLGMMKLIEKSGLINIIKKVLQPLVYFLFPRIPRGHPAMNAILMNMSANLLGMGNAATPFGIKAMQQLQTLNPKRDTASNEMCTFAVINTAGLTLLPTTVIALRAAAGSLNPAEIVGPTMAAMFCSTCIAIIADCLIRRRSGW